MAEKQSGIPIQQLIEALVDESKPFPPYYLKRFSGLEGQELDAVEQAWPKVNPTRRVAIMEDLKEWADEDLLMFFENFARRVLSDTEEKVRVTALSLLWDNSDKDYLPTVMTMLHKDPSADVRAAAATGLGKYIYEGEMEELDPALLVLVEDTLLNVLRSDEDTLVRRRALESLGWSSREEVPDLIRKAYASNDKDWLTSALFAMGRSADGSFEPEVKRMLKHANRDVQFEAVRAAGELALASTTGVLLDLLDEEAQDPDIHEATIWSLSQIGGEGVRDKLEKMLEEADEDEDEEEMELLQDAIDNLEFTEMTLKMDLFDLDLEDEDELGDIIDLEETGNEDDDEDEEEG